MKKIINEPSNFVEETIEGIIFAYGDKLKNLNGDKRIILTNTSFFVDIVIVSPILL